MILVFEDLVHHTEAVLRRVCNQVGLTFSTTLLQPTFNRLPIASNSHFESSFRIDGQVTERYRTVLSEQELRAIESRTLPLYERVCASFGYGRGSSS